MTLRRKDMMKLSPAARAEVNRQLKAGEPIPKTDAAFDSEEERRYYEHLKRLQLAGEISELDRQVRVDLHIGQRYMRIDFHYYINRTDEWVWDDYKMANWKRNRWFKDWKLKRDIWVAGFGPGLLRITTRRSGTYHAEDSYPKPTGEALRRILCNARATMNPAEFGSILAGHYGEENTERLGDNP